MPLPSLPGSDDEYWDGAEKIKSVNIPIKICNTHRKDNFMTHNGYIDNHDGTFSCKFCPWGSFLGVLKIVNNKLLDVRSL